MTREDAEFMREFARSVGIEQDITTCEDLETAIAERLGLARFTLEWEIEWLWTQIQRTPPTDRVVQDAPMPGSKPNGRPQMRPRRTQQ